MCKSSCIICIYAIFFFEGSGHHRNLHSFPTRRSSDLPLHRTGCRLRCSPISLRGWSRRSSHRRLSSSCCRRSRRAPRDRSEEHTSELQSLRHLVCRLLLEKKKMYNNIFLLHLLSLM